MKSPILSEEIVAVPISRSKTEVTFVEDDEHTRPDTTQEALQKLKPIVKPTGTITAGNSSGINDGACAMIIASEDSAKKNGLTPRARIWVNRIIGDRQPNAAKKYTFTSMPFYKPTSPLLPSGLLGPVQIIRSDRAPR